MQNIFHVTATRLHFIQRKWKGIFDITLPRCASALGLAVGLLLAAGFTSESSAQPTDIVYTPGPAGRYPESLAFDSRNKRYIVSSGTGQLGAVDGKGNYSVFAQDADANPATSGAGVYVDLERDRVFSVQNDFGGGNNSIVAIHDLEGSLIKTIDLDELHEGKRTFANVIRVAQDGAAYITDSWSPLIYTIDVKLEAKVFFTSPLFETSAPFDAQGQALFGAAGFALKGNTLFVTHSEAVKLYAIELSDNPADNPAASPEIVEIPYPSSSVPPLVDGIVFLGDRQLALIANWSRTVVVLESDDNWKSAALSDKRWVAPHGMPTEGELVNSQLMVINSHFDALVASFDGGVHRDQFEIHVVDFGANKR